MALPKPLGYYTTSSQAVQFHLIHVGEGLMVLLVFPDQSTMLVDCNVTEDNESGVLTHLEKFIPSRFNVNTLSQEKWIDVFVNSHRHVDHLRGLKKVNEQYPIRSIWDSGQSGATEDAEYEYYMRLRRKLITELGENAVIVPAPSRSPLVNFGGARVFCLSSSLEYQSAWRSFTEHAAQLASNRAAKPQHTNSLVLSIQFAERSILLTGDSDWRAWRDEIVPNFGDSGLLNSEILVASHHGSRSFFTDEELNDTIDEEENPETTYVESIEHISPSVVLIPCGRYSEAHHPNKDALEIYMAHVPNKSHKQVYTTQKKGIFCGHISLDGRWTVSPYRFRPLNSQGAPNFDLVCQVTHNGIEEVKHSGDYFPLESTVSFSIRPSGGLMDPLDKIVVDWEVSNGGDFDDHEHDDIYYKGEDEAQGTFHFVRQVSYRGRHLLRCRVYNKKKRFNVTRIFVVNAAF